MKTIHTLDYYHDKRPDFVFDKCRTVNQATGFPELRPRTDHNQDNVDIYYACPKGCEVVIYKERQIGWTCDLTACITTDMIFETPSFTAYWQSIDDDHSKAVLALSELIVTNFDFPLPPEYKNFIDGEWNIEIPPDDSEELGKDDGKDCHFQAFSKRPTNITGRTPSVFVIDEAAKFDPPSLYEEAKREAKAAVRTAKFFKNSTTLFGNTFEKEVKLAPIIGPSYEEHLETFKVPTYEQWLKARNELAEKKIKALHGEINKKSKKH